MATPATTAADSKSPPAPSTPYAYMFEKDKSPTKQLDALLRAIARHIIREIGDKSDLKLTPKKLAAFYKDVGGSYDSLFIEMPHESISFVWQVTGCQHSLQPTDDDFERPSVPALTFRGFSRWESLEILLGPEEHVPFLQYAVTNWELKHPDTGEPFPLDLPADVFPAEADMDVDRWHKSCGDRLRMEAAYREREKAAKVDPVPEQPEPRFAYTHAYARDPAARHRSDDAEHSRPFAYTHVPSRHPGSHGSRMTGLTPDQARRGSPPDEGRRRSLSDYPSPPQNVESPYTSWPPEYADPGPKRPTQSRRHSHPDHSVDSSGDEHATMHPRMKRRQHPDSPPPPPIRRFVPPTVPQPPAAVSNPPPGFRNHRSEIRADDSKRRSVPSPRGSFRSKLHETVSSLLPGSSATARPRGGSRQNSYDEPLRPRRSREKFPPSRLTRSYSDIDSEETSDQESSDGEHRRRRRMPDDRDRDRIREKGRADRERDDDRDLGSRRDRPYLRRPEVQRRTSSHADIDRRREQPPWDPPRERERVERVDRRKWDRRDSRNVSPVTGVSGRRYPDQQAY